MGTTAQKLAYLQETKELFIDALSDLLTGFIVFDASKETLRNLATKYVLGSNRSNIPKGAFSNCEGIVSVIIPDSVTMIGNESFALCTGLTSVTIGNSVTRIGYDAFYRCSVLTSVAVGNGVTSIGFDAFKFCSGLSSITLPDSITSIESGAFSGCSGLTSVTLTALIPPTLGSSAFSNTNNCPIYVPAESVDAYKLATNWSEYASRIQAIPQE